LMCRSSYNDVHISKPLVQYEQVDYPLEDYNSAAIKIGNNGQWVMITSGLNHNYLLFQFKGIEEGFAYKQIKLPANLTVEDAGLYLDNEKQQGFAGILSRVRNPGIKNVRVINYSIDSFRINFDTSYLLNTLAKNKIRNENIFEEYFMLVPGKGFLFLKEYGQSFPADEDAERFNDTGQDADDTKNSGETGAPLLFNRDEYTRYDNLAGTRSNFERGDLTLYYFPATKSDSCWSGIINKEQVTELGTSYLSYVFLPREDKLFFLYNSFYRNRDQYSSTTVLDQKGNAMNEGIEYWKINNTLVFQKARQISENELAIPYERNMRNGFAIIHL